MSARTLLQLFADRPLEDRRRDFFGFHKYADAIAELIDNESTSTPLTLAISAPWGAGKTSVARMVERRLSALSANRRGVRPNIICWFNAWMHDDAPHLGAAMAAHVAATVDRKRAVWRKLLQPVPAAMLSPRQRWIRRCGLIVAAAILAAIVATRSGLRDDLAATGGKQATAIAQTGGVALFVIVFSLVWSRIFSAAETVARFFDDPQSESARGTMGQVSSQLRKLIKHARRRGRLVIFIDDLERCTPARAIEVCEVAAQLTAHPGVVTVFIADMHVIAESAEEKLGGSSGTGDLGRRFLEKIVQVEVAIPPPRTEDMKRLLEGGVPEWKADEDLQPIEVAGEEAQDGDFTWREQVQNSLKAGGAGVAAVTAVAAGPLAAVTAGAVIVTATAVPAGYRRWRTDSDRKAVTAVIEDEDVRGREGLTERVLARLKKRRHPLARQMLASYLIDKSPELEQVEEILLKYPPVLPRSAKRMLNTARLLTHIARERDVFDDELTPAHLGEWIVLNERWNSLAQRVQQDPGLLTSLENAAAESRSQLVKRLEAEKLPCADAELLHAMLTDDPRLGDVAQRLIRCEPRVPAGAGRSR